MAEDEPFDLAREIEAGLREAVAHRRGEVALPTRRINPMPAERVRAIRKSVAKSTHEFERRFGVPARTVEGWERGKQPDPAARVLLRVIETNPAAVEQALAAGASETP